MRLSIGTNFSEDLLQNIEDTHVKCLFGKLTSDIIGGGRPSFALPQVDEEIIVTHIANTHKRGIEFNYLLNSVCLDNLELTKMTNKEIIYFLHKIREWKVDWVTITIPYLINLVKKQLPEVRISISTFSNVDSIQKAKFYENLGVDEITLPESCNRNFSFLSQLKKSTKMDYQLIATNDCLLSCQYRHHHPIFQSHASQTNHITKGFALDYCLLRCTQYRLKDPSQYIKSPWIRPEDLGIYEELGFDKFKITERLKNTKSLKKVISAYSDRHFDGNLAEILNIRMNQEDFVFPNFSYNENSDFADPEKFTNIYRLLFSNKVFIDNRKLDGFINFFIKKDFDCLQSDCNSCGYCNRIANNVIKINDDEAKKSLERFDEVFEELDSGKFFEEKKGSCIWNEDIHELLHKIIKEKPIFIRKIAYSQIKKRSEELSKEESLNEVSLKNLLIANFEMTPKAFHKQILQSFPKIGISIDNFPEIVEKFNLKGYEK